MFKQSKKLYKNKKAKKFNKKMFKLYKKLKFNPEKN